MRSGKHARGAGSLVSDVWGDDWFRLVLRYFNPQALLQYRQLAKHIDPIVCALVTTLRLQPVYGGIASARQLHSFAATLGRCTRTLTTLSVSWEHDALGWSALTPEHITLMVSTLSAGLVRTTCLRSLRLPGLSMSDRDLVVLVRSLVQSPSRHSLTNLLLSELDLVPSAILQLCLLAEGCPILERFAVAGRAMYATSNPVAEALLGRLGRALPRLHTCVVGQFPFLGMGTFLRNLTCPDLRTLGVYCQNLSPGVESVPYIMTIGVRPALQELSLRDCWATGTISSAQLTEALRPLTGLRTLWVWTVSHAVSAALLDMVPRLPSLTTVTVQHFVGSVAESTAFHETLAQRLLDNTLRAAK
jgi:hypothetical protein